jgi:hypothetical protein
VSIDRQARIALASAMSTSVVTITRLASPFASQVCGAVSIDIRACTGDTSSQAVPMKWPTKCRPGVRLSAIACSTRSRRLSSGGCSAAGAACVSLIVDLPGWIAR